MAEKHSWLFIVLFIFGFSEAEDKLKPASAKRFFQVSLGPSYSLAEIFSVQASPGLTFDLDYGWQIRKTATASGTWVSLPLGGSAFFSKEENKTAFFMLRYGWSMKHYFHVFKNYSLFYSYRLLLNQLYLKNRSGRSIGHETGFECGFDGRQAQKPGLLCKAGLALVNFPSLDRPESERAIVLYLLSGVSW